MVLEQNRGKRRRELQGTGTEVGKEDGGEVRGGGEGDMRRGTEPKYSTKPESSLPFIAARGPYNPTLYWEGGK